MAPAVTTGYQKSTVCRSASVSRVKLRAVTCLCEASRTHHTGHGLVERLQERPVDKGLRRPNRVKAGTPFLAAQRLEIVDGCRFAEIVAEDRDVDVL